MLNPDFTPPSPDVARLETDRRLKAIDLFIPKVKNVVTSITVSGSMASGRNYAVTETSDIDMQLTVTEESVHHLKNIDIFSDHDIDKSITAYTQGLIKQFSFSLRINDISHECHFWDEQALIDAMHMKTESTKRIRTSDATPAMDYGFAFDGSQDSYECPTEEIDGLYISVLPSFRFVEGKLFLCRPVTNWLSLPNVVLDTELLQSHIDNTWEMVVRKLVEATEAPLDLKENNILNALPSKFKASPEAKELIMQRTQHELAKLGVAYSTN